MHRHVVWTRRTWPTPSERETSTAAHAELACALDVVPAGCRRPSRPRAAAPPPARSAASKMLRMRLHVAVVGRRDRDGEEPFELEVGLERGQRALRVRDEADLEAGRVERAQHLWHLLVQREVMARGPLVVDIPRGALDARSVDRPSPSMMRMVYSTKICGIVGVAAWLRDATRPRSRRGSNDSASTVDAVPRAEIAVAHRPERRPGINQREVDVEEDCAGDHWSAGIHSVASRAPQSATARAPGAEARRRPRGPRPA